MAAADFSRGHCKNTWICTEFQCLQMQHSEIQRISSISNNSSSPKQSQPWNWKLSRCGSGKFSAATDISALYGPHRSTWGISLCVIKDYFKNHISRNKIRRRWLKNVTFVKKLVFKNFCMFPKIFLSKRCAVERSKEQKKCYFKFVSFSLSIGRYISIKFQSWRIFINI